MADISRLGFNDTLMIGVFAVGLTCLSIWAAISRLGCSDVLASGVVAAVGSTEIMADEYQQAYRRQVEMYKQLFGDKPKDKRTYDYVNGIFG